MTLFAFVIGVTIGIGSLAYSYSQAGYQPLAVGLLVFGATWIYTGWRRKAWFSSLGILGTVVLAGVGLWLDFSLVWMLAAAMGGLIAWDLAEFLRRMGFAAKDDDKRGLERRHLARLTILVVIATLLSSVAMLVRLEFSFEWSLVLVLVAALGITQLVSWLRREGE